MPLTWSEQRDPNAECSYTHVVAETPLGRIFIEWKGWKDFDAPICNLPWGELITGSDHEDTKVQAQIAWNEMVRNVAALATN